MLVFLFIAFLGITSCSRKTQDTIQKTEVRYIDSTIWHTDTTFITISRERVVDVVNWLDTLRLETEFANSVAYVDTATHTLKGSLENKNKQVPIEIKWKEKIVNKDSLVYVKEPYEVKVVEYKTPNWMKWYLSLTLLGALIIILIKTRTKWLQILLKILH